MDKINSAFRNIVFGLFCCVFLTTVSATASATPPPRYLEAVKQELARLQFLPNCQEAQGICTFQTAAGQNNTTKSQQIVVNVDDRSATIYIIIENFHEAKNLTLEQAKKLLEINQKLVSTKFSLDTESQNITLSAVINTDSNFDRKTFRSVLMGFIEVAQQYTGVITLAVK